MEKRRWWGENRSTYASGEVLHPGGGQSEGAADEGNENGECEEARSEHCRYVETGGGGASGPPTSLPTPSIPYAPVLRALRLIRHLEFFS